MGNDNIDGAVQQWLFTPRLSQAEIFDGLEEYCIIP